MVNVNVALHSGNEILEFYIPGQINSEFDLENNTIEIYMNEQIDDYSNLIAEFILSEGATAFVNEIEQFSEETANDFNSEFVIYNIIAEDGTSSEWKIFVPFICDWDPHSSINQINNSSLFKIFPNPNNGTLKLSIELDDIKTFNIEVLNVNGKLVKQIEVVNYQIENSIDLSELNSGLYYIKVNTAKETMVQKISIIK